MNGPTAERKQPAHTAPDAVLRALADPHRRQILRLVQHTELPAGRIAATFTLTQQAVSQHIGVLKQAGLLEPVRELLAEFWPDALSRLKKAVETAHPRPPKRQP
jgi:DNA-binding transcriptional ArsR family regulator